GCGKSLAGIRRFHVLIPFTTRFSLLLQFYRFLLQKAPGTEAFDYPRYNSCTKTYCLFHYY
ncbi:hypothetical protein KAX14_05215, partial [Candidatus Bipolaricaulota bacterium]|nr:hypothetical protein [Candidatus Bipolaricaulota bacterium]